jgi:phospholipase C
MSSRLTRIASVTGIAGLALTALAATGPAAAATGAGESAPTTTPIKHVIVIIGENHSFDNVFATYQPPGGQSIWNLRSEGIVTANGTPGPNFSQATQLTASNTKTYTVTPKITGTYKTLPQPNTTYVATGCDGLPGNSPDTRFPATLPDGPYQITKYVPYNDDHSQYTGGCEFNGAFVGDPIHRFYQMWQQTAADHGRLFTWVANSAGDDNGTVPPAPIFQGGLQTGFYNMAQGDAPVLNDLAQHYAISDNYHQAVEGGTGANHIALGTGFAASYQNAAGQAAAPPGGEIENPDPSRPRTTTTPRTATAAPSSRTRAAATPSAPTRASRASGPSTRTWPRCPTRRSRTASRAASTC